MPIEAEREYGVIVGEGGYMCVPLGSALRVDLGEGQGRDKFGFGGDGELTSSLAGKKLKGLTTQTRTVAKAEVAAARTWTATEHRFPFDEQECLFRFSSWTYDANKLNLTLRSTDVNTEGYMLNGVSLLENYLLLSFSQPDPVLLCSSQFCE